MPTHHPMDNLHQHLERHVQHGPELEAETAKAAAAHQERTDRERQNEGNPGLPNGGQ